MPHFIVTIGATIAPPDGITAFTNVECRAKGSDGTGGTQDDPGIPGGGGSYAKLNSLTVVPGSGIDFVITNMSVFVKDTGTVLAITGPDSSSNVGDVKEDGGAGDGSGGGQGAHSGGLGGANGGFGGDGENGIAPGGGGGAGGQGDGTTTNGGTGGAGRIEYDRATSTPNIPTGLSGTVIGSSAVNLAFTNSSISSTTVTVRRAKDAAYTIESTDFVLAGNATTYGDIGLEAATTYYYKVRTNFSTDSTSSAFTSSINKTTNVGTGNPASMAGEPFGF